jgi:hypothetical protein
VLVVTARKTNKRTNEGTKTNKRTNKEKEGKKKIPTGGMDVRLL